MKWKEENLPALLELEATVLQVWSRHAEMNDCTASRAYEAAYQRYAPACGDTNPNRRPSTDSTLTLSAPSIRG